MKKGLKITLISLASILVVLIIIISCALWYVFSPSKLTPMVRDFLNEKVLAETSIEEVEPTFFSSFPDFGVRIQDFVAKKTINNLRNDTLLNVEELQANINLIKFIFNKEVILNDFTLSNGELNLFVNSNGDSNYDVFPKDSLDNDTSVFKIPFDFIDIHSIKLNNVSLSYINEQNNMSASLANLNMSLKDLFKDEKLDTKGSISANNISFSQSDSVPIVLYTDNLDVEFDCDIHKHNFDVMVDVQMDSLNVVNNNNVLVSKRNLLFHLPISGDFDDDINFNFGDKTLVDIENNKIWMNGLVSKKEDAMEFDLKAYTDNLDINAVLSLLPDNIRSSMNKITLTGDAKVSELTVKGEVKDTIMPTVYAKINISDASYEQKGLDLKLSRITGDILAELCLSDNSASTVFIENIDLKANNSNLSIRGKIGDVMNSMLCDVNLRGDINLADLNQFLSDSIDIEGSSKANFNGKFTIDDITDFNLKKIKLKGDMAMKNIRLVYNDSISVVAPELDIAVNIPSLSNNNNFEEMIDLELKNSRFITASINSNMDIKLNNPKLNIQLSDISDSDKPLSISCLYDMKRLEVQMDEIKADISTPMGSVSMLTHKESPTTYIIDIMSPELTGNYGRDLIINTSKIDLSGDITYDPQKKNIFLQFAPNIKSKINHLKIASSNLADNIIIPILDFNLTPYEMIVNDSRFIIKNSDFKLNGSIRNISDYLNNESMLIAKMDFISDKVEVNELMDLVSGFGAKDDAEKAALLEQPQDGDKDPFMVPWNVDVVLNTKVSHGRVSDTDIYDLGGILIIRDGVMVLEQMGFTCEAAKMQLTAIYRSERKNHLFAGIDFHLLDIQIDKLIDMVPQVDTIVPMLKYFDGKGEFHLAAETYLKSNYDIKFSTLRGASAIEGKNLVLLDNETFNKMSKMLFFKKKTKNVVDSLSVELTVFRDEVELYPFLFCMDKYKVVMQGMYNLSHNYKIKAESIAPIKIGVDLTSSPKGGLKLDKLKLFNLKYRNLYNPEKRNKTQQQVLELKKMIADALKVNVKK